MTVASKRVGFRQSNYAITCGTILRAHLCKKYMADVLSRRLQMLQDYEDGLVSIDQVRETTQEMHAYLAAERAKLRRAVFNLSVVREESKRLRACAAKYCTVAKVVTDE